MINKVILRGYVADDPFVRSTERGKFVRVRLVTIEKLYAKSGDVVRNHTEWHTLSFWGELADVADREVKVGTPIQIEGALRTREWEDRDGILRKTTEITVKSLDVLKFIEGCTPPPFIISNNSNYKQSENQQTIEIKTPAEDPDELPF